MRQPWAGLILRGGKDVENRSRNIAGSYRGPIVVHSSRTLATIPDGIPNPWSTLYDIVGIGPDNLVDNLGCALGVVDLLDVHDERGCPGLSCSPWADEGSVHLLLAHPHAFAEPIPYRGKLGLWDFPDDLLRQADLNGWAT